MSIDAEAIQTAEPQPQAVVASKPTKPRPEPVAGFERVASVDVLRGVALLGILAMNIVFFALPGPAYSNPTRGGGDSGLNLFLWIFNHLVFDGKMMTLFSMLFGAGLVLMGDRADARGASLGWVYYRRVLWLLVIGGLHAYLLWSGDILVLYAECGLVLYPFRRRSARTLIIVGILAMLVIMPLGMGIRTGIGFLESTAARAEAARAAGERPTKFQAWIHELWTKEVQPKLEPSHEKKDEKYNKEVETYRGRYWGIVRHNAGELLAGQTIAFVIELLWAVGGRMLLGMGLMKLGVFSASRSWRFYGRMAALGYGLGLPLVGYDTYALLRHDFHYSQEFLSTFVYNYVGTVLVALGHAGAVMLICKSGALSWLTRRLAAVGRMALTNYLMQSVICTTLFYGYGFCLYGRFDRTGLAGVVLAIWVFQLAISPVWLRYFRFGPAEWLWRSLTYWRLQPMRRQPQPALA
jgi:uncharacterized protein